MHLPSQPARRLGFLCLATLLLSSCPRAGVLPYGVEVSGEEGGLPQFSLVKAPSFSVSNAATLYAPATLTISTETPETEILYTTTPGAEPAETFPQGGILLDGNVTIRARAVRNDFAKSSIVERHYSFKVPDPIFSRQGPTTIRIECAIQGATLLYSTPSSNLSLFTTNSSIDVTVAATKTLYAKGTKQNWEDSSLVSFTN